MATLPKQVTEFLGEKRIAVAGVSRNSGQAANFVYKKLRDAGYQVFAVNPNATQIDGQSCYPDLHSVPGPLGAVVIATHPDVSAKLVRECAEVGVRRVWLHRSFGQGSVSDEAVRECERLGIDCLAGGCPAMYCAPVDFGHRCMKWILKLQHRVPV